ncbi:hypothetical protein ARMGADRAFT_1074657 [Armillaria gallica]|uniref:Uncharacterized protein n=1 Tax=Armillaria gallica TaxID=47427 RepID=A0A2H3E0F9_ARMGA|nr:hypothetical protein ARMGADRAFT_1074657 [Armillaria gallica]
MFPVGTWWIAQRHDVAMVCDTFRGGTEPRCSLLGPHTGFLNSKLFMGEAVAAYAMKNKIQVSSLRLTPLQDITFPAIAIVGTSPIFYKVTVTADLSNAVQQGTYPQAETTVLRYVPAS